MGLFDLDELPALASQFRLFGYNRASPISFHEADHGDGSGLPLRPQVETALVDAEMEPPGGAIRLLCMPRVLGYVFNPLSVYFCHDPAGQLRAIVHEVNNTFGERHFYALPATSGPGGKVIQDCAKQFRVSPFLPMDLDYRFVIDPPGDQTSVTIQVQRNGEDVMTAWFSGKRRPISDVALFREWVRHPVMTLKVIAGIHWEALLLWRKLRRKDTDIVAARPSHIKPPVKSGAS